MAFARAIRTSLAALLVAAQLATGSLAAQMTAQGAPCPVNAALVSAGDHTSAHHGHTVDEAAAHSHGHDHPAGEEEDGAAPHFSLACCAACVAAFIASGTQFLPPDWERGPEPAVARGLEPGELPSTDPPPRVLL